MSYDCKIYGAKGLHDQKQIYVIAFPFKASRSERIETLCTLVNIKDLDRIILEYLLKQDELVFIKLEQIVKDEYSLVCDYGWPIVTNSVGREQVYELDWWFDNEMKKKVNVTTYSGVSGATITIEDGLKYKQEEFSENVGMDSKRFHPVKLDQAFDPALGESVGVLNTIKVVDDSKEEVVPDIHESIDVEKTKTELHKSFVSRILYILTSRWTMELVGQAFWDPIAGKMVYYHEDCFGVRYMTFAQNRLQAFFFHRVKIENAK